jgi:UDP:flavonoid glycosyltransferase YjiC (YdhE family)
MRAYFAPCGIGLGHVGRIVPIAKRLREENFEVAFSTYGEGVDYIEHEKLPLMKAPPISFQVKPDGSVDFRRTAMNPGPFLASFTLLKQVDAEIKFIESFKPDIIVSDSRITSLVAARLLGIPRICILNQFQLIVPRRKQHLYLARVADSGMLTLIGRVWTSGNTVLIPDFPPPYTISAGNLNIPKPYRKNVRLIGPILDVRPDELISKSELREKLGLSTDKPVIFAPISGSTKEKAFLTGTLRRTLLEFSEDYEIIMSLGYPDANSKPVRYGNLTIHKWIPNRFEYLKACDVIVSRAGHGTITQAMCYGKPLILVPTPNHPEQINNAKQAKDLGVAEVLLQKDVKKSELLGLIQKALEDGTQERLKMVQRQVLPYDGVEEAVRTITATASSEQSFKLK